MQWMTDDRGAVGVFMAITIVVLFAMLGLTVDVGALYDERRQLSNGADAAVLAIAEDCALGVISCDQATATAIAKRFAAANARDDATFVDEVSIDLAARTVRVQVSTLDPEGGHLLEPFFAQVVGYDGTTVRASATAAWGFPSSMRNVLPLIISECEFPVGMPIPSAERILFFHDGNNAEPCNAHAGQDADGDGILAGGFGWLDTVGGCRLDLASGQWVNADPGSSPTTGCSPSDLSVLVGTAVPLPIFDDLVGLGEGGEYHISGFALFFITGYNFGGQFRFNPPCSGDERCVSGFFTSGVVHDGGVGGVDRGIVIVKLTG